MVTTPHPTKQSAVADKREAILRAALEVFAERGVNGVAVPEIASRAGVGTGTIYRYFESKEELVNELYRKEKKAFGARLNSDPKPQLAPRERFDDLWDRLVAFAREQPEAYRFLELQDHLPYLDSKSRESEREVLKGVYARMQALQENGVFRSDARPEVMMAMVWGAFVNLFKAERLGYFTVSDRDVATARDACWRMCTGE